MEELYNHFKNRTLNTDICVDMNKIINTSKKCYAKFAIKLEDINKQIINTLEPDLIMYDSPFFISKELINFDLFDELTKDYQPYIIIHCMRYFLSRMVILQNEKIYSLTKGNDGIIFNKLWLSVLPEINNNNNYISTAVKLLNHNLDYPVKINPVKLPERQNKTINLIICMRNNEKYFYYFEKKMEELEQMYNVNFFIFENDSTDKTKELIHNFIKNRSGKTSLNTFNTQCYIDKEVSQQRTEKMAFYRNESKKLTEGFSSDYTVILDTDITFDTIDIHNLILSLNDEYIMMTPFTICNAVFRKLGVIHYYDTLPMKFGGLCPFEKCLVCRNTGFPFDNQKFINLYNGVKKFEYCFGGLVAIKSDVFNKCEWGYTNYPCEHTYFCDNINKYGSIGLNTNVICYYE